MYKYMDVGYGLKLLWLQVIRRDGILKLVVSLNYYKTYKKLILKFAMAARNIDVASSR